MEQRRGEICPGANNAHSYSSGHSALDFDRVYFLSSWIIHGSDDRDLHRFFGSPLSRNVSGFKK
jgi:hypothetical protein